MDVTPRKRASVIALHENTNFTQREISAKCKVSLSSVNRIIKLKNETGSVSPRRKGNCGRKRATTPRDDAFLLRKSKVDLKKIALIFKKISQKIVRRRTKNTKACKETAFDCDNDEEATVMGQ